MCHWHEKNLETYLLIRNGARAYRISTEVDFHPRLLPFRDEFHKPLVKEATWSNEKDRTITPEHVEYDEMIDARTKTMMHYNRITFLLQGLLDRSKCFEPHPPIALNDPAQVDQWVRLKYDEEDGLPSANPPDWNVYRDALNSKLRKGVIIWGWYEYEVRQSHGLEASRPQGQWVLPIGASQSGEAHRHV
jgi:hypothetical protein